MKCLACQHHNPPFVIYCQSCGAYLGTDLSGNLLDLVKSGIFAIATTAFFYAVYPIPVTSNAYLIQLFSGHIAEAITAMSFWAVGLLFLKFRQYRFQKKGYQQFLTASIHEHLQTLSNTESFECLQSIGKHLKSKGQHRFQNLLIFRRIRRILQGTQPTQEFSQEFLSSQADIDFNRMENNYVSLQFLIWAIPILGFIGTVYGIGESIGEFSSFIQSVETDSLGGQMRSALGGVTLGLAVAFNTTFLALVCVIPIMMATSFLKKFEEDLLLRIDEFCLEEISSLPTHETAVSDLASMESDTPESIRSVSELWLSKLSPIFDQTEQHTETLKHQVQGLSPVIQQLSEVLMQLKKKLEEVESSQEKETGSQEESKRESV